MYRALVNEARQQCGWKLLRSVFANSLDFLLLFVNIRVKRVLKFNHLPADSPPLARFYIILVEVYSGMNLGDDATVIPMSNSEKSFVAL